MSAGPVPLRADQFTGACGFVVVGVVLQSAMDTRGHTLLIVALYERFASATELLINPIQLRPRGHNRDSASPCHAAVSLSSGFSKRRRWLSKPLAFLCQTVFKLRSPFSPGKGQTHRLLWSAQDGWLMTTIESEGAFAEAWGHRCAQRVERPYVF